MSSSVAKTTDKKANTDSAGSQLMIEGASCASCVSKIENALCSVVGVDQAHMNLAQGTAITYGDADTNVLISALEQIGYRAEVLEDKSEHDILDEKDRVDQVHYKRLMRDAVISLGLGIPLMLYGLFIGEMSVNSGSERIAWGLVGLVTLAVIFTSGRHFYVGGWKSIVSHTANMDTLIMLGTGTAWLYSMVVVFAPALLPEVSRHVYFEATAMILGLINLGKALEVKARGRTSEAIKRLIGLRVKTARVLRGEGPNGALEIDIPIEEVMVGDILRIRPGERIPVDGVVTQGNTVVDESMLSGEPIPVEKAVGDKVSSGTLTKSGSILFRVTRVGKDTALARIISMVKHAQNSKPPIGRLADVISAYFVPSIMIIAVASAMIWLNFGPPQSVAFAMASATTVLIIACPCALGLATPMSVMVGIGKAAEAGMLIRNGEALQTTSKVSVMVLDKTGTITLGAPTVADIVCVSTESKDHMLGLAASLESGSEHPLACAILDAAHDREVRLSQVSNFVATAGYGLQGIIDGQLVYFGNQRLMQERGIETDSLVDRVQILASEAKTPMYLAADGKLLGIVAVADPVKDDSVDAIKRLHARGLRVIMMTGDNRATAAAVARSVGINEYYAELLPEHKTDKISALQKQGEVVAMAGDGINDAPALALADVGFAIGSGTDVAIESADVTLMRGSLHGLVDAIAISRATLRNVKQNLFGAFVYNTAGVPIAAGILYPFFGLLLSPIIAGAAMALSSLTVVANSNRLRLFEANAR